MTNQTTTKQTSEIKIEKGIDIPNRFKYPVDKLTEVGDSFFVPGNDATHVQSACAWLAKKLKFKLTCRSIDGGCRVWRIK